MGVGVDRDDDDDGGNSRVAQGRKEDENHPHHLIYRKLPEGVDGVEDAAAMTAPRSPPGGEYRGDRFYDEYGNEISPREHDHRVKEMQHRREWEELNRRGREERIRAREERINNNGRGAGRDDRFDGGWTMNYGDDNNVNNDNSAEREYFYNNDNNEVLSSRREREPHAGEEGILDRERRNREESEARRLRVRPAALERDNRRHGRDAGSHKGRSSDTKYLRRRSRVERLNNN